MDMMDECTGESPLLFVSLNEVCDDTDDVAPDTEDVDSSKPGCFGASLKSHRTKPEERQKGNRFSHKLHKIDYSKEHELLTYLKEGDELVYVNKMHVSSWSHEALISTIQDLDETITLTFYRKSEKYIENNLVKETDEQFIEIVFVIDDLGSDNKGTIGDITSHIKKVSVNILNTVTYSQRLTNIRYEGSSKVKIQHGAMEHDYLMVEGSKPVMKPANRSDACNFTMYSFLAHDEKTDKLPSIVAFQCDMNKKYLMCKRCSKKLSFVKDDDINKEMTDIAANSPCLFFMIRSDSKFFFESVAYPDYFLTYDTVDLLRVEKIDPPPTSPDFKTNDYIRRNFTFDILQV